MAMTGTDVGKWALGILSAFLIMAVAGGFKTLYEIDKQQALMHSEQEHQKEIDSIVVEQLKQINTVLSAALETESIRVDKIEKRLNSLDSTVRQGFSNLEDQIQQLK